MDQKDHMASGRNCGGENRGHDKADDLAVPALYRVKGPALGALCAVACGNIRLGTGQYGCLVAVHERFARFQPVCVVKAQAAAVADDDHADIRDRRA